MTTSNTSTPTPIFSAGSVVSHGKFQPGSVIHWFITSRDDGQENRFPAPVDDLFEDLNDADHFGQLDSARQLFNQNEIDQFRAWLKEHNGMDLFVTEQPLPIIAIPNYRDKSSSATEGIIKLNEQSAWNLPFIVHGYTDFGFNYASATNAQYSFLLDSDKPTTDVPLPNVFLMERYTEDNREHWLYIKIGVDDGQSKQTAAVMFSSKGAAEKFFNNKKEWSIKSRQFGICELDYGELFEILNVIVRSERGPTFIAIDPESFAPNQKIRTIGVVDLFLSFSAYHKLQTPTSGVFVEATIQKTSTKPPTEIEKELLEQI